LKTFYKSPLQERILLKDLEDWFLNSYFQRMLKHKFNNVIEYLAYRRINAGVKPYINLIEIGFGYDFPLDTHKNKTFLVLNKLCGEYVAIVKYIYSFNKEIKTEENLCNILTIFNLDETFHYLLVSKTDDILDIISKINYEERIINEVAYREELLNYCENKIFLLWSFRMVQSFLSL
jgi:hypothetical protein